MPTDTTAGLLLAPVLVPPIPRAQARLPVTSPPTDVIVARAVLDASPRPRQRLPLVRTTAHLMAIKTSRIHAPTAIEGVPRETLGARILSAISSLPTTSLRRLLPLPKATSPPRMIARLVVVKVSHVLQTFQKHKLTTGAYNRDEHKQSAAGQGQGQCRVDTCEREGRIWDQAIPSVTFTPCHAVKRCRCLC